MPSCPRKRMLYYRPANARVLQAFPSLAILGCLHSYLHTFANACAARLASPACNHFQRGASHPNQRMAYHVLASSVSILRCNRQRIPSPTGQKLHHMVFDLQNPQRGKPTDRLWNITTRTANRWINRAMTIAGIKQHSPKSLRHTFGVRCSMKGLPLPTIKDLMGHANINTTTIYATPMGEEKKELVRKLWL